MNPKIEAILNKLTPGIMGAGMVGGSLSQLGGLGYTGANILSDKNTKKDAQNAGSLYFGGMGAGLGSALPTVITEGKLPARNPKLSALLTALGLVGGASAGSYVGDKVGGFLHDV